MTDDRSALLPLKAGSKTRHLSLLRPFSTHINYSEVPGEQELRYHLPTKALSIKRDFAGRELQSDPVSSALDWEDFRCGCVGHPSPEAGPDTGPQGCSLRQPPRGWVPPPLAGTGHPQQHHLLRPMHPPLPPPTVTPHPQAK